MLQKLAGHEVKIWNDHSRYSMRWPKRARILEALVLIRERTEIARRCSSGLDKLRLISQRSVYPHNRHRACTRRGVRCFVEQHPGTPSQAAAELTWALVLAAMRQVCRSRCQRSKRGSGRSASATACTAGRWESRLRQDRERRRGLRKAFGMNVLVWCARGFAQAGARRRLRRGARKQPSFRSATVIFAPQRAWSKERAAS